MDSQDKKGAGLTFGTDPQGGHGFPGQEGAGLTFAPDPQGATGATFGDFDQGQRTFRGDATSSNAFGLQGLIENFAKTGIEPPQLQNITPTIQLTPAQPCPDAAT